jgi:hypothetical protein
MNKRGLSDIVVSVLLILLVLSAIVIIWSFVRPVVLGASKDVRTDDFTTKLEVYPQADQNGVIQFSVKRGAGKGNLAGFYVSYQDSTGKAVTDNFNYTNISLGELESKSISFNYISAGLVNVTKISIVPLFNLPDNTVQTGKNVVVKQIGSSGSGSNPICTPNCGGRQCGSDGCGGTCGSCQSGQSCNSTGQCVILPTKLMGWIETPNSNGNPLIDYHQLDSSKTSYYVYATDGAGYQRAVYFISNKTFNAGENMTYDFYYNSSNHYSEGVGVVIGNSMPLSYAFIGSWSGSISNWGAETGKYHSILKVNSNSVNITFVTPSGVSKSYIQSVSVPLTLGVAVECGHIGNIAVNFSNFQYN